MKNSKFIKRIVAGLSSFALATTMLAGFPAFAEDSVEDYQYYSTLDPNGEEYQNWKAGLTESVGANSKKSMRKSALKNNTIIANDYIEFNTTQYGLYTIGTTGGNPNSTTDDNKKMLYGHPGGSTSKTTINVGGSINQFRSSNVTYDAENSKSISTATYDGVDVMQEISIIENSATGRDDVAQIKYSVKNSTDSTKQVGLRIMMDTMLGGNDAAPFRVNGTNVTTETEYTGSNIPQIWQAFDSVTNPGVVAQGTFYKSGDLKPDKVQFTNWGNVTSTLWNYATRPGNSNGDSAVSITWDTDDLSSGETREYVTYYGLSELEQNLVPPIALSVYADNTLEYKNGQYGNANLSIYLDNISNVNVNNVVLSISTPNYLEKVTGSNSPITYSAMASGSHKALNLSYKLKSDVAVNKDLEDEIKITLTYPIDAGNNEVKEITKKIKIPKIDKAIVVVPGIAGTRLFANSDMNSKDYLLPEYNVNKHNKYSYNSGHQFWEPETSKGTNKLAAATYYQNEIQSEVMMLICDAAGKSLSDIRPETSNESSQYGAQNTYTKLVNDLKSEFGNEYCVDFFAYDWRENVNDTADNLETYIDDQEYDDVILVCHSMGGLVASKYIANSPTNRNKVDKLITLGTPYLGAPKALYVFETGGLLDNTTTTFCMGTPIKAVVNNFTSVYELLPTKNYFDLNDTTYVQYQNNNGFWHKKTTKKQSYFETQNMIKSREWYFDDETPKNFIDVSENFADSLFINGEHITSKVDSYYVIGYNKDTILEVEEEYNKDDSFNKCNDLTIANGGDGTVPIISANIGGLADSKKTYYIQASHTGMVKNKSVIDLVKNIVKGNPDKYDEEKISKDLPEEVNEKHWYGDKSIRIKLKVECPVDLAMIGDDDEEWAYVNPAYIYNENPDEGTFYHFGKNNDAKMAFLQDNNYNVKLIGTDKGEMKYTMSVLDSGKEIQRIVFEKIEITDTTVIYTNTDRFNSIVLNVDIDNDGVIDYQVNPSYILTEDEIDNLENNYANETTLFFQNSSIITSSVETGIQIYSGSVNINKSISTDGLCEIYANEVNAIDCNSSALYINGQTAESKKQLSYLEATKGIDELLYDVQDTMPEDAVSTTETDMIYFTTHNISDFITANSISIYLDKIISDENCVLYSRNGDINISGSEINYNGIIYAPNGIVTISANDVCISGTIIAKKVIVYGNDVTFK